MATYLKRTSKLFDLSLSQASGEMNLRDLMCPVCRGILIEPVTLPCTHNLCLRCLKGTFEHNSLSCPLCRIRVGSWLRTASKSESLVNGALWQHIRSRYPKEIESKNSDDVTDIDSQGYAPKILSAPGEIRREYEKQLQIAEQEMRRQRESERLADEELIRKIQQEEAKLKFEQLAQDKLLARTLAKRQLLDKEKMKPQYCIKNPLINRKYLQDEMEMKKTERNCNFNLLSKIQAERIVGGMKKDVKSCESQAAARNALTLKHQPATSFTYSEPGCSNFKIYGDQSEEELRVPSDVLSSNKKSLGVEVCITSAHDKRIGSAQSAGSHDSINPEIHHFKPIRAMSRTPLKAGHDGRQVDPKLIRVLPTIKRVLNPVIRPPSLLHIKKILGCSWSAFKEFLVSGRSKQESKPIEIELDCETPSALPQTSQQSLKPEFTETTEKLEFPPNISIDSNKNYTKNPTRQANCSKLPKKLIVEVESDELKTKPRPCNGSIIKNKKRKSASVESLDVVAENLASTSLAGKSELSEAEQTVENIAERIKRRKIGAGNNLSAVESVKKASGTRSKAKTKRQDVKDVNSPMERTRGRKRKAQNMNKKLNHAEEMAGTEDERDTRSLEDRAIEEQAQIERLLLQEKKDYELAQRLQRQFNEMERISGRTRGSRRALELKDAAVSVNDKMRINGKLSKSRGRARHD